MVELLNLPDLSLCLRYNFPRKRSVVKSRRSTLTLHSIHLRKSFIAAAFFGLENRLGINSHVNVDMG
jgi:hypothetical protein